jgi:hypothetical protein
MNPLVRLMLLAVAIAVVATTAVWLSIMPDEPEDALEDGLIASLSASLIVLVVSRRSRG